MPRYYRLTLYGYPVSVSSDTDTHRGEKIMASKEVTKAVAYFRTSSMANVGDDKDTLKARDRPTPR
jgi:hypothetical protein